MTVPEVGAIRITFPLLLVNLCSSLQPVTARPCWRGALVCSPDEVHVATTHRLRHFCESGNHWGQHEKEDHEGAAWNPQRGYGGEEQSTDRLGLQ